MAATADKFSRLAALKPARAMPARPSSLRSPDEEDALGRLLGAGVSKNRFGEHLAVRNWFSTPEFTDPSNIALALLSRTRDESLSRKTHAALKDPEKWLFLDTETTGLAGGTVRLDAGVYFGLTTIDPTVGFSAGFTYVFNAFKVP